MTEAVTGGAERIFNARPVLWVFLVFLIVHVAITRGHFVGTDEIAVYQATRSLWEEGDLATGRINNTFPGRGGRTYGQYSAGQSVAALPLYGLGKTLGHALVRVGGEDWVATFAGPSIGSEPSRWGGDIEIFFVNLFNAITTALLCAVFFAFSLRLGAAPRWSVASTALLGLTSYVAPFSIGFLQHSSEALFLLWAFYFLFSDSREPDWRSRAWAGVMVAVMLLFRFPSLVALPGLACYLLWGVVRRRPAGRTLASWLPTTLRQVLPFAAAVAAGLLAHLAINHVKFETIWGLYNNEGFHTPLLTGLHAFLLSPGDSIVLFTPLLLLTPWTFRHFAKRRRAETVLILFLTVSYLVFYGKYTAWHGLWSALGPRYLVPITPLLLLPLASWMEHRGRAAWLAVGPLGAIGLWVQVVHVAVNFAYVYHHERYPDFQPPYGFLFVPRLAPVLAHSRALLAGDFRVDMWLVNVYRVWGLPRVLVIAGPLLAMLSVCVWRLRRSLEVTAADAAIDFTPRRSRAIALVVALVWALTAVGLVLGSHRKAPETASAISAPDIEGAHMRAGLDLLYARQDPGAAVEEFRKVLARNPTHYGATFQLAMALERAGRSAEAGPMWHTVLRMAEQYNDAATAATARARLANSPAPRR